MPHVHRLDRYRSDVHLMVAHRLDLVHLVGLGNLQEVQVIDSIVPYLIPKYYTLPHFYESKFCFLQADMPLDNFIYITSCSFLKLSCYFISNFNYSLVLN